MQSRDESVSISKAALWAGRIIIALFGLFMLLDGVMKLVKPAFVVKGTLEAGFPESSILGLGIALTVSSILYLVPRTSIFGAILLTGYLGGAVATHVRLSHGTVEVLFPVVFGVLIWLGLYLCDVRLRALIPLKS
jgi:hypothetical protein